MGTGAAVSLAGDDGVTVVTIPGDASLVQGGADDQYLTASDLADYGFTPADVGRLAPWAVEYRALDGAPCWLAADLTGLLTRRGGAA
jgi:hypothetical protein